MSYVNLTGDDACVIRWQRSAQREQIVHDTTQAESSVQVRQSLKRGAALPLILLSELEVDPAVMAVRERESLVQ